MLLFAFNERGANVMSGPTNSTIGTPDKPDDLNQFPLPEHLSMRWRTRIEIASFAELEPNVPYRVGQVAHVYMRSVKRQLPDGCLIHVVDLYHDEAVAIQEAAVRGREASELLADMLALAAYGPAAVLRIAGTGPTHCVVDQPYEIATFQSKSFNSPVKVSPDVLETFVDTMGDHPLRSVRLGMSVRTPSESFVSFWNAVEVIATNKGIANGDYRSYECAKCKFVRSSDNVDTKKYFEAMYDVIGSKDRDRFKRHTSLRGKIQHGKSPPDIEGQKAIQLDAAEMRRIAIAAAAIEYGIKPQTANFSVGYQWPITVWTCTTNAERVTNVNFSRQWATVVRAGLPPELCGDQGRATANGYSAEYQLEPDAPPPMMN
jgi:hypothetical protein